MSSAGEQRKFESMRDLPAEINGGGHRTSGELEPFSDSD
ncbi:hypothetical protein NB311A_17219 [Nitrobacter sp. Nb-311A]|nr:hypothetical protein NB311A_17219 [Nitrobacter sp. Nb-311A]